MSTKPHKASSQAGHRNLLRSLPDLVQSTEKVSGEERLALLRVQWTLLFSLLFLVFTNDIQAQSREGEIIVPVRGSYFVNSLQPSTSYSESESFFAEAWTNAADTQILRSSIEFDLSPIEDDWIIQRVEMDLFHNSTSARQDNTGFNTCYLRRTIDSWDASSLNWNNQPALSDINQIAILESENPVNLSGLEITDLFLDILDDATTNAGIALQLETEGIFRYMGFASSNHPDSTLHPVVRVYFEDTSSGGEVNGLLDAQLSEQLEVFPNPFTHSFSIDFSSLLGDELAEGDELEIMLMDMQGRLIWRRQERLISTSALRVDAAAQSIEAGTYLLHVRHQDFWLSKPLIKLN